MMWLMLILCLRKTRMVVVIMAAVTAVRVVVLSLINMPTRGQ